MVKRLAAIVVALLAMSGPTSAEERRGAVYLTGGISAVRQPGPSGETQENYVAAPGGTTLGWTASIGVFLGATVSVEAELSGTGVMEAREASRYGYTYNESRRDWFFGPLCRFHLPLGTGADFEPVGGLSFVRHVGSSTAERIVGWPMSPGPVEYEAKQAVDVPTSVAYTVGADLRFGRGRVAFVPSFRYRHRMGDIGDDSRIGSWYPGGFPDSTTSYGASLRVGF